MADVYIQGPPVNPGSGSPLRAYYLSLTDYFRAALPRHHGLGQVVPNLPDYFQGSRVFLYPQQWIEYGVILLA